MPVAKSYQKLNIIGEPYKVNGRMYVKLETGKQVRWYTDEEYKKLYGSAPAADSKPKTEKEALGFANGFITIFKGDTYAAIEWFRASVCKYNKIFGWYCPSTEEIPSDIPIGIEPIRIEWDAVSAEDGVSLRGETFAKEYAQQFLFDASHSEFVGEVGKRIEVVVTVTKAIELNGFYGPSTMHIMEDCNENIFVWTTSAKKLVYGSKYTLRGTVKAHSTYKNTKQTVLTRCSVVEV